MTNVKIAMVTEQEADTIRVYVPISRRRVAEGSIALSKAQLHSATRRRLIGT